MAKIDSVEALIRAVQAGARIRYLHFWGHRPRPDGQVSASCLSQWWPAPFVVDGVEYPTAEHWMMAAKARLFGDAEAERAVLAAGHPAEAKKAGRLVRGFDETTWERERLGIVTQGSVHKFAAAPELRDFLLATGDRVLVEASPLDRVWGIGLAATDAAAEDPGRWRRLNLLGFALMAARNQLQSDAPGPTQRSAGLPTDGIWPTCTGTGLPTDGTWPTRTGTGLPTDETRPT